MHFYKVQLSTFCNCHVYTCSFRVHLHSTSVYAPSLTVMCAYLCYLLWLVKHLDLWPCNWHNRHQNAVCAHIRACGEYRQIKNVISTCIKCRLFDPVEPPLSPPPTKEAWEEIGGDWFQHNMAQLHCGPTCAFCSVLSSSWLNFKNYK